MKLILAIRNDIYFLRDHNILNFFFKFNISKTYLLNFYYNDFNKKKSYNLFIYLFIVSIKNLFII